MSVTYIEDYLAQEPKGQPRQICFFSPTFRDTEGTDKSLNICIEVKDGDVAGILSKIREDGGIVQESEDGTFHFLPWPCAAVEIRDSDSADGENRQPSSPE